MLNLISAEWLKLTRRPLTWALLAIFLGLLIVQILTQFLFASIVGVPQNPSGNLAAQIEEYHRRSTFPGIFGTALGHVNGLGGIFAVILTAGAMGGEYTWGTLRTQLARQPSRARYLLAKIATLLLLLLAATLLALLLGVLGGWALGSLADRLARVAGSAPPPPVNWGAALAELPLGIIRALYVLLPYVLLTLCLTILGRSLLAGAAGGLVYLVFEGGFGALAAIARLGGLWQTIYNLTIGQNINTLVVLNSHAFGLRPEAVAPVLNLDLLPSPLHATLVVAFYSACFLAMALWLFQRSDITGPA